MDISQLARNLQQDDKGVWAPVSQSAISYPAHGNSVTSTSKQKSFFWFRHRNRCLKELLNRFPPQGTMSRRGRGNGFVSLKPQESGHAVVLVEPGPQGAMNASYRGNPSCRLFLLSRTQGSFRKAWTWRVASMSSSTSEDSGTFLRDLPVPAARRTVVSRRFPHIPSCGRRRTWMRAIFAATQHRCWLEELQRAGFQVEYQTYLFPVPGASSRWLRVDFRIGSASRAAKGLRT